MAGKKGMHKATYMREDALERIRQRIVNSQIADRIVKHALGEIEMSQSQVRAAEVLLRKVMPDLASQEIADKRSHWTDLLQRLAKQEVSKPAPQPEADDQASSSPGLTH